MIMHKSCIIYVIFEFFSKNYTALRKCFWKTWLMSMIVYYLCLAAEAKFDIYFSPTRPSLAVLEVTFLYCYRKLKKMRKSGLSLSCGIFECMFELEIRKKHQNEPIIPIFWNNGCIEFYTKFFMIKTKNVKNANTKHFEWKKMLSVVFRP